MTITQWIFDTPWFALGVISLAIALGTCDILERRDRARENCQLRHPAKKWEQHDSFYKKKYKIK